MVREQEFFPAATRDGLASALNRIGIASLGSCEAHIEKKGAIPILGSASERHGGSEVFEDWEVEASSKGKSPLSNSFTFRSADKLADVRYYKLVLLVGLVCRPVRELTPRVHKARLAALQEATETGTQPMPSIGGELQSEAVDDAGVETKKFVRTTSRPAWPRVLIGFTFGGVLGATGAWLWFRRRAA